jgi:N-acetylglucosaminyl-diphospho-decaprenol L-rhamnosyltransferase
MRPSLDIVIVNWNAGRQLQQCLESIRAANCDRFDLSRLVVVDNASSDGSAENLDHPELPLHVIRNSRNRGFGAACNQGAASGTGDYLLFLNPDMVLFADSLSTPMAFMQDTKNRQIGICGIQLVDEDGLVSRSCASFPNAGLMCGRMLGIDRLFPGYVPPHFMPGKQHCSSRRVDQVMGAFMLVRRALFEQLHGFDERFFVYFEDLDFALRCRQAGFDSFYLVDARAMHAGCGCSRHARAAVLLYNLRSRIQYGWKHFGIFGGSAVLLGTLLVEPIVRLVRGILLRSSDEVWQTSKAYVSLWGQSARLIFNRR